jgi:glyoxalase family protein
MARPSLHGIHHVSAVTGRAADNVRFYTQVLGLRLVTKTVNQDDTSSYHLFYGDETGAPGTDLTFFDVPHARALQRGTGLISGTSLRVRGADSLEWWAERLDRHDVRHSGRHERAGRAALTFFDAEGQTLHLVDDSDDMERVPDTTPWADGPVPVEHAIRGLGPVEMTVADPDPTHSALTNAFGLREARPFTVEGDAAEGTTPDDAAAATVYETEPGGVAAELHVVARPGADRGWLGTGGVHHLALRTPDSNTILDCRAHIVEAGLEPSPVIDRHYFESVYTREPGGILIEIATDTGTPFPVEEAAAGQLTLPPKLEPQREAIEQKLEPLPSTS